MKFSIYKKEENIRSGFGIAVGKAYSANIHNLERLGERQIDRQGKKDHKIDNVNKLRDRQRDCE